MKDILPDNSRLYRLPYSKNDNPNGWIEVTTYCNMKCPGCYKGIDRQENDPRHEPLEKIKDEILQLKRIRNCGIITISGGEALMHPQIEELVAFVKSIGLSSFIHTNGILINKEVAGKLRKSGLTGFVVRIDSNNFPGYTTEKSLHHRRSEIATIVNQVGGLQLGFTCVVTRKNLDDVADVVKWFQQAHKLADYLVLILKREFQFHPEERNSRSDEVTIEELVQQLSHDLPPLAFCSYLGSTKENIGYKWLQSGWIAHNGKVLGYSDGRMAELSTVWGHWKNGNYSYVTGIPRNRVGLAKMVLSSFLVPSMRRILRNYLSGLFKSPLSMPGTPNHQVLNIVNPPSGHNAEPDYCDACPDAVLHDGMLVPSCTRESIHSLHNHLCYADQS